jgi:hypothetical protein
VSEYGPALFVRRVDGAHLSEEEQAAVLELVRHACGGLTLLGPEGAPAEPVIYDHNGYEEHAVGILLYSSFVYQEMPEEVQAEEEDGWKRDGDLLAAEIERQRPGVYTFACYGVET